MTGAGAGMRNGRSDMRGVRHTVRIRRPAAALFAGRVAGDIARPHNHRKTKLVCPRVVPERFDVANSDFDFRAGRDVCHRLRKDVRPLLVE